MRISFIVILIISVGGALSILLCLFLMEEFPIEIVSISLYVQISTVLLSSYIALFVMYWKFSGLPLKKQFLKSKL